MAKLVEEGDHVVVRQQGGLAVHAFGEVAHQMRHGCLQHAGVGALPAAAHVVHPGTAAFAGAGWGVEVELAHQLAFAFDAVKAHGGVPDRGLVGADVHFEQGFNDLEQPGQHFGGGEVLLDLLLAETVARFLQFFAQVGHVPGVQRASDAQGVGCKFAQVGQVFFGKGAGFGC